jgi:hypothetical protein
VRTTLTLDDDVAKLVRELSEKRRRSFKETVNEVMRAGLTVLGRSRPGRRAPYRIRPVSLGRPRLPDLDDVAEVLAIAEGEDRH